MNRGGGIWFSKDGQSSYNLVSENSVYPPGKYEDPVIWRTNIQYHMIVNDWKGRIAYYMRSKDGINWKLAPGEAYVPGLAVYEDGTNENWFKYERLKMFQDKYGRAVQANFAVVDTLKRLDLGSDRHSSKNIGIPLTYGRLITILNEEQINSDTKSIKVKIQAEKGFNPHIDIDLETLRFGAPEEVNFGKGCKVIETKKSGKDLILIFNGGGNGITERNFTGKLIGKTSKGKLLFGYARLPWIDYLQPALSACLPKIVLKNDKAFIEVEVQNFGQTVSETANIIIQQKEHEKWSTKIRGAVEPLQPFESTIIKLERPINFVNSEIKDVRVVISHPNQKEISLTGQVSIQCEK